MENINTFQWHLRLANKSRGFRFQSATVLVNTSITKSLFIVLSKCLGSRCCSVLCYLSDKFPNLCLLASLIVSISGSNNSSVEHTFSFVTDIVSDKCLSMSHNTLKNSVIVSGDNSIWSEKEREEIIDRALEIKHRITTLSSEADSVTKLMMNTMKMTWTVKTDA